MENLLVHLFQIKNSENEEKNVAYIIFHRRGAVAQVLAEQDDYSVYYNWLSCVFCSLFFCVRHEGAIFPRSLAELFITRFSGRDE